MSWLSKLTGIHISPKGVKIEPWKALTTAAAFIPGVGPAVSGALKSIPGVSAVTGALSHIPGVSKVGGALANMAGLGGGDAPDSLPGIPELDPITGQIIGGSGGSGGGGIWDTITGAVKKIPGVGDALGSVLGTIGDHPLETALGAGGGLLVKQALDRSNDLQKQALGHREAAYSAAAPLRTSGLSGMQSASAPRRGSLDDVFANPSNPFYVPPKAIKPAAQPPQPTDVAAPASQPGSVGGIAGHATGRGTPGLTGLMGTAKRIPIAQGGVR